MAVLGNFVSFEEGVPKRIHIVGDTTVDRVIHDPVLNIDKPLTTLTLVVDELDGERVTQVLSVTSENLAAQLMPWTQGKRYLQNDFIITMRGAGFQRRYTVEVVPRR